MRALLLALVLLTSASASAQALRPAFNFQGGTLTAPLVLDATNTLCSQALSLSFNGDSDLGLQRSAANIALFCASGGVVFNGVITLPSLGSCATADIRRAGAANSGFSVSDATGRPSVCSAGNTWEFQASAIVTPTNSELGFTGVGMVDASATAAGVNLRVASSANAAGEFGVSVGTNAALVSGATLDTPVLDVCYDCDGTPVHPLIVTAQGHLVSVGTDATTFNTGTCGTPSGAGTDFHGTISATCNNQTAIVHFGRAAGANVSCTVSAMNAAATAAFATTSYVVATTGITITQTGNIAAETWAYFCGE